MESRAEEPRYAIGVAAKLIGVHAQTLRYYERMGVIEPARSPGKQRLYSLRDIERLRQVRTPLRRLWHPWKSYERSFRRTKLFNM